MELYNFDQSHSKYEHEVNGNEVNCINETLFPVRTICNEPRTFSPNSKGKRFSLLYRKTISHSSAESSSEDCDSDTATKDCKKTHERQSNYASAFENMSKQKHLTGRFSHNAQYNNLLGNRLSLYSRNPNTTISSSGSIVSHPHTSLKKSHLFSDDYNQERPMFLDADTEYLLRNGDACKNDGINKIATSNGNSDDSGHESQLLNSHFVVVAIDFGTTFSGYAFALTKDPDGIHMMRKWEGGDPGVVNQKTPTTMLLTPRGEFHSFGFHARDYFHDLEPQESKNWLYFEKFKMHLHHTQELDTDTMLTASNGKKVPAMAIFTYALKYFKEHALRELSEQSGAKIVNEDVRWVITVPAIWRQPAKAFMRHAAYLAGIASPENPDQLLIALEPEAASIYIRKLKMSELLPADLAFSNDEFVYEKSPRSNRSNKSKYMVVDCGGGTVDITVHELDLSAGVLKELYKATGGPYGSTAVDNEFENVLSCIFSQEFMDAFKIKRPAGFVDLMIAFEARKRTASASKTNPLNISLPFSFIDFYKKYKGCSVETAIRKYGNPNYKWSSQGMLRLSPEAMVALFRPVLEKIKRAISEVLCMPEVSDVKYLFLVGGFAESPILQQELKRSFSHTTKIIIPQDVSLAILKGAVLFGLDPTVVNVRRSRLTYGVGILNKFINGIHPTEKLLHKDGIDWCADIFDKFVLVDQSVGLGDVVIRSYTPANHLQTQSVIHFYCSESDKPLFVTDPGVRKIGTLVLNLSETVKENINQRREIQTRMIFGDTEIKVSALDVTTGKCVRATIDFLNK